MPEHPYGAWSLVPPLLAITLAIATRQVFLSLFAGIWIGYVVIAFGPDGGASVIGGLFDGTIAAIDACVDVFRDPGNTRVVIFSALVGSLIALIQRSGGVEGFVRRASSSGLVRGPRSAGLFTMAVGAVVFVESSISCLVTGTVSRPIFDRLRLSREKLAYICDSTSAPVCILIPLNGWGAFILAQLTLLGVSQPVSVLLKATMLNFYAIVSLALMIFLLVTNRDFGPMAAAQRRARDEGKLHRDGAQPLVSDEVTSLLAVAGVPLRAVNMLLPVAVMVLMMPIGIAYTGLTSLAPGQERTIWTVLDACSGTKSVLWAVLTAVVVAGVLYRCQGIMRLREIIDVSFKGAGGLLPLAVLMVLAFAIGTLCKSGLQTGPYVAGLVPQTMSPVLVAPLVFAIACGIAFSTGTSWGTFAIMLPIALPIAEKVGVPPHLAVAAVLAGGVFGDHCSPISDTTIVSSMASACDHIDHVRTQLPYALAAGAAAIVLFAVAGGIMAG
jgi:Na+/H+ antiporter NhaC